MATTVLKKFLSFRYYVKVSQIHTRRCSTINMEKEHMEDSARVYVSTRDEYKVGRNYAVAKLQELFKLNHSDAIETAMRFKILYKVMGKTLSDNYNLLRTKVPDAIILNFLNILADSNLNVKLLLLKKLPMDTKDAFPLLQMSVDDLEVFVNGYQQEIGRIKRLSSLLDIPVLDVNAALIKRPFLRKLCLEKLEKKLQLLREYEISFEEIRNDYWVLLYKYEVIQERLEFAKDCGISKFKTWMVRAQTDILDKYVQRRSDNKLILGNKTLAEYLSRRLNCTLETAKFILLKHPALYHKHMKRIKEVIDMLYADGFTPTHIIRNPKILLHSVETTEKRLKELKALGQKLDTLYMLTKSKRQYLDHYQNLVKANKGKVK